MNETVLIVDDKKVNIDMMTHILRRDYTIMAATGGEAAIRIMEKRQPDLVLLDVYMPGMSGMDVLAYMKSNPLLAGIPVIFVTGEHEAYMEEKGLELGAADYIKKPYNAAIVGYKVRNHLEFKAYRDHLETLVYERTKQLSASREAIIMGMSLMSESHDKITGLHIERIKMFTGILCLKIQELFPDMMSAKLTESIMLYSPLHDVGKVGIADGVLKKEGALTSQEYDIIKRHTVYGADLLRKTERFLKDSNESSQMDVAIEIAECHHERFDGTGYPHGLKGEDIPLSARIVSIADVYDALRSPRSYKNAYTHHEAVKIILSGDNRTSPSHFDPYALEAFAQTEGMFEKSYH